MTLQIKERIVGIIVVVCLVLIWGPFFLSRKPSETIAQKDTTPTPNQSNSTVAIDNTKPVANQQLVENTLPPQTQEEQVQPKQIPVLPMPASSQQAVEDEDIAPESSDVTLQWSGRHAEQQKATKSKSAAPIKEIPDEEQVIEVKAKQSVAPNRENEDVNDEKMIKTSEANEAKLQKLFEKNEQSTVQVQVVKSSAITALKKPTTTKTIANLNNAKKEVETKSIMSNKWIVEVATLSNPHYVAILKQKLAKSGFTAFSRVGHSDSGNSIYYVWIGAENNREQAEALAKRLQQASHMTGKVTKSSKV